MDVQYSEISTREVVVIGDLCQQAWEYTITKRTNKALGLRAVYARVDPVTRWVTVSTNRAKPIDVVPC